MNKILPHIFLSKLKTSIAWIVNNALLLRKNGKVKSIRQTLTDITFTDTYAVMMPARSAHFISKLTRPILSDEYA
ncbi:hypothetical protein [Pseudoalteromonas sp. Of7M-16]|uniref:hypothetical protein n=1 Tax=Pseudoalteromonas sp. Of7M-16 TaxID=2917756 RepID=UPI001EF63690|nr:hypothetical protein [Pseudoalteromonas sp. Of7M-16]MCG7546626.1 hypothetical protein [Pseudoalteromonas sp. Of7M-16]